MAEVHDECGIAAVYLKENGDASKKALFYLYKMLLNLQNRGQLSTGFTTYNKNRSALINTYRQLGPVNEVFRTRSQQRSAELFRKYEGNKGIGHVRYATCGLEERSYAQPFERKHGRKWKWFSFGFNGTIANYKELKAELMKKTDYHFILEADTEIVMHYIARELMGRNKPDMVNVFSNLSKGFDGAYNIAFVNGYGDLAVCRDPLGIRPLSYGIKDGMMLAASESNALQNSGMKKFHSLEPGKVITVEGDSIEVKRFAKSKRKAHCMFEYVYFANVSSVIDGRSVYLTRTRLGQELAKLETEKITPDHIVVPVPDSGKAAGDAMAYALGVPSMEGLIRNRYVGRTFIEGSGRNNMIQNKFTVLRKILRDKKVILVDDSVVRGATSEKIVRFLKNEGGAKEVHLRVSCPPIKAPCFYGIDMSTISELLAPQYEKELDPEKISDKTCEKIAKDLGADSVIYQTIPGLVRSIGLPKGDLCMACLNSDYPTPCGKKLYKNSLSNYKQGKQEEGMTARNC